MPRLGPLLCALALALADPGVVVSTGVTGHRESEPLPSESDRTTLQREVERLRGEAELARGKGFYLRLDARRGRLALLLEGVTLEEHAVERLETGVLRVGFWPRPPSPDWPLLVYRGGRLSPPRERDRVEVVAPAPSSSGQSTTEDAPAPPVPPTAEEAYSVPGRYRILFEPGLALEVVAHDGGRNRPPLQRGADALGLRAADLRDALSIHPSLRVRVRIALSAAEAASLYRALPPDVALTMAGLSPD
jgi:hypothetical protein